MTIDKEHLDFWNLDKILNTLSEIQTSYIPLQVFPEEINLQTYTFQRLILIHTRPNVVHNDANLSILHNMSNIIFIAKAKIRLSLMKWLCMFLKGYPFLSPYLSKLF